MEAGIFHKGWVIDRKQGEVIIRIAVLRLQNKGPLPTQAKAAKGLVPHPGSKVSTTDRQVATIFLAGFGNNQCSFIDQVAPARELKRELRRGIAAAGDLIREP